MTQPTVPGTPDGFDLLGQDYFRDPTKIYERVREEAPVFFYPPIKRWIVSRREDVERWITDFETFTNSGNFDPHSVPAAYDHRVPGELLARGMVGSDPPGHTHQRKIAQRGFTRGHMSALEPEITQRAHHLIDEFVERGECELMNTYALELTTQTIFALLDLPEQDHGWFRMNRFDSFRVLAAAQEPIPEDEVVDVWDRYAAAHERLREIVEERREGNGTDVISEMAHARMPDGTPALETEWIAMHATELAAAGTDTTAQLICNAVMFLSENEEQLQDALGEPSLWGNVVEETLRRRPSAPFVSRKAEREVEIAGVRIPAGDWVWFSLASANNDPSHYEHPERFDIHRAKPSDHLGFSKGRHLCEGSPLARVQGEAGLRALYQRIPSLRMVRDQPSDFAPLAMLPIRLGMQVSWHQPTAG
jgi:cytochrome P450